jgi:hypothetical protein
MESRLRMVLVLCGLPTPQVQYPLLDDQRRRVVWLDLAYPEHLVAVEYEGANHVRSERVLRDVGRYTKLVDQGWRDLPLHEVRSVASPTGSSRRWRED